MSLDTSPGADFGPGQNEKALAVPEPQSALVLPAVTAAGMKAAMA